MALMHPIAFGKTKGGQMQEVICPRCRVGLEGETFSSGDGIGMRKVEGLYKCSCGYQIEVIERYPVINRAPED